MISLLDQKKAIEDCSEIYHKHILLWGPPFSGKTHVAATAIMAPQIKRVYWLDSENGLETLMYARTSSGKPLLSDEHLAKVIPFNIADSTETPRFADTVLRTFRPGQSKPKVCTKHGTVGCKLCTDQVLFNLKDCGDEDLVVIETGSQLADSVLALSLNANNYKDLRKYYGDFTLDMIPIVTAIQAARTNIIMTTHEIDLTKMSNGKETVIETIPLCGSRNFSKKIAKYFNYRAYTYMSGSSHAITHVPNKVPKIRQVGLRRGVSLLDTAGQPTLQNIFNPIAPLEDMAHTTGPQLKIT